MNKRDCLLRNAFSLNVNFDRKSTNRAVRVSNDEKGNWVCTVAYLHNNAIVRKDSLGLYVRTAGWPTRTTASAIRACLHGGWKLSSWKLHSPNGAVVKVPDGHNWVKVEDPWVSYYCGWEWQ